MEITEELRRKARKRLDMGDPEPGKALREVGQAFKRLFIDDYAGFQMPEEKAPVQTPSPAKAPVQTPASVKTPARTVPPAKPTVTRHSVNEDLNRRYQQRLDSPEYTAARDQALMQSDTNRGQMAQDWMARSHPNYDPKQGMAQNLDVMAKDNPRYRKYLEDTAQEAAGGKNVLDAATGRYFTGDQYNALRERFPLPQDRGKTHVDITRGSQGTERANFMDGRYQGSSYQVAPQPIMGKLETMSRGADGNMTKRDVPYNTGQMSEAQSTANTLNMTPDQLARLQRATGQGRQEKPKKPLDLFGSKTPDQVSSYFKDAETGEYNPARLRFAQDLVDTNNISDYGTLVSEMEGYKQFASAPVEERRKIMDRLRKVRPTLADTYMKYLTAEEQEALR